MKKIFKRLWDRYIAGAAANNFPISRYGFLGRIKKPQ